MRVLFYSIQSALKNLWAEKWINLLTAFSVGIGLLILSTFITVTFNMDSVLKRWARSFGIVVYLDDDISAEATDTVRELFKQDADVLEVNYISEDEALRELRLILGSEASILDDLERNPLPSSFELKLKRDLLIPSYVKKKAEEIEEMSGISQVQYGEKWLASLNTVTRIMKASSIFLGGAILIAIIFITYNTIKIFFYRRKEEIETLKLLGATKSFIRLPFLLEGLIIGIVGGTIGSLALFGIHSVLVAKGLDFIPSVRAIIVSIPDEIFLSVPVAGALMSFIGSFIAVGKIRY
ncbi:MAG: ABC transporter permease [Nitrospiraceae bacterium]|nr:MAG: ABC transporter permease [Nitrospiraceae bacterium]